MLLAGNTKITSRPKYYLLCFNYIGPALRYVDDHTETKCLGVAATGSKLRRIRKHEEEGRDSWQDIVGKTIRAPPDDGRSAGGGGLGDSDDKEERFVQPRWSNEQDPPHRSFGAKRLGHESEAERRELLRARKSALGSCYGGRKELRERIHTTQARLYAAREPKATEPLPSFTPNTRLSSTSSPYHARAPAGPAASHHHIGKDEKNKDLHERIYAVTK